MTGEEFEQKYMRPIMGVLTAYESIAIFSRRIPTISAMVWWLYKRWWGQAILWSLWGWLTAHFFREAAHGAATEAIKEEVKKNTFIALLKRERGE